MLTKKGEEKTGFTEGKVKDRAGHELSKVQMDGVAHNKGSC